MDQLESVESDRLTAEATQPIRETALAVRQSPLVVPAVDAAGMKQAMDAYTAMCAAILTPSDMQTITVKGKPVTFKKRSAWQKLATAFSVTTTHVDRTVHVDNNGQVVRAEFVVRATAPNGRSADGYGACSISERRFDKPDHDVPSTAETRARNRACADLFAFGELTAEEMTADGTAGSAGVYAGNPATTSKAGASPVPSGAPRPLARNPVRLVRASQGPPDSDGAKEDHVAANLQLTATQTANVAETPAVPGMLWKSDRPEDIERAELRLGILKGYAVLLGTMTKYSGWSPEDLDVRAQDVVDQWCQIGWRKPLHELTLPQLRDASAKLEENLAKRVVRESA
jgi:hypothetical protein